MARQGWKIWVLVIIGIIVGVVATVLVFKYTGLDRYIVHEEGPETTPDHVSGARLKPRRPPDTGQTAIKPPALNVRVAIVIDDMGSDMKRLRELFKINADITIAVLPHLAYSKKAATEAHDKRGWEVLLHLPMEPKGFDAGETGKDPGKGALYTSMSPKDVMAMVEEDLKGVPFAIGVNNHMGSKFTEDEPLMRAVFEVVRKKRLFFLDSRTTSNSVVDKVSREMKVRSADRSVFLDNTRDERYITGQIDELVAMARRNGTAIAIGHPYPETISALRQRVPGLANEGVDVVKLSNLITR